MYPINSPSPIVGVDQERSQACPEQASSPASTKFAYPSSTLSLGLPCPRSTRKGRMGTRRLSSTSINANRNVWRIGRRYVRLITTCESVLTYYKGQEIVRRQHMLPHRPQLSHCLLTSRWNRGLHRREFSRHRGATVRPSHLRVPGRLCIRTFAFQSSERDVRSKDRNDINLCWIYCLHTGLRPGTYVASTPHVSLPRRTLCRCALHFRRGDMCRSLFERCSSRTSHHGVYDSKFSILFSSHLTDLVQGS